jgi:hypothetical protein
MESNWFEAVRIIDLSWQSFWYYWVLAGPVQSTGDLFIYLFLEGGVEEEKKMCATVTGICYSSRPVKVHEREVGTVTGPCIRVVAVHTGGYCWQDPVLLLEQCSERGGRDLQL